MASKINIFNMTLGFLGTRTITSETDKCEEAIQCNLYWDTARHSVLSMYPFQFAQRKRNLAEKVMPEEYKSIWRYAYALPDKCLNAQAVTDTNNYYERKYFEIVVTEKGEKILLCDLSPCYLHFTEDVNDVSRFDDLFTTALAYKLATLICIPLLKNNSSKLQELIQLFEMSMPKAVQKDAREQKQKPYIDEWISSRN